MHRVREEGDHKEAVRQLGSPGLRQECHDNLPADESNAIALSCSGERLEPTRVEPSPKGDYQRKDRQEEDCPQGREDIRRFHCRCQPSYEPILAAERSWKSRHGLEKGCLADQPK